VSWLCRLGLHRWRWFGWSSVGLGSPDFVEGEIFHCTRGNCEAVREELSA
jgi:hypothetical protein